jgi:hypothetical protein
MHSQDDIKKIGKELDDTFNNECLPFFDKIESVIDVLDISLKTIVNMPVEKLSHAILLNMVGNKAEADQLIDGLRSDSHWGDRALGISERLSHRS